MSANVVSGMAIIQIACLFRVFVTDADEGSEMTDEYRQQRVERLLRELEYEIQVGMMQGEIDESLGFRFYVPQSKQLQGGVVFCEFRTRPIHAHSIMGRDLQAETKLTVVK